MEVNQYAKEIKKINPDFKVVLGNEIYLVDERKNGIKYYHFILMAKNARGHRALRELSTKAWYNSYIDRGMERVPLLKEELSSIMTKYKGDVIATTACMGGELSSAAYNMLCSEKDNNIEEAKIYYNQICNFIEYCLKIFGEDFYIECAPSENKDQIATNQKLLKIAKAYNIPIVVGTDSHYLTKNDRYVHKAYLNSKDGEREVDSFYEFAYLMNYDEVFNLLMKSFKDEQIVNEILNNSNLLGSKFEDYSLERKQIIPKVKVKDYPKCSAWEWDFYPTIRDLLASDNIQERYWVNECLHELIKWGFDGDKEYCERLETEASIIKFIGDNLEDCLFAYFNTFKHYIDLFWECGSIVGPGRGSSTGFLSNALLGITQLDPIRWGLPYWR